MMRLLHRVTPVTVQSTDLPVVSLDAETHFRTSIGQDGNRRWMHGPCTQPVGCFCIEGMSDADVCTAVRAIIDNHAAYWTRLQELAKQEGPQ